MTRLYLATLFALTGSVICPFPKTLLADGNVLAYLEQNASGHVTLVIQGDQRDNHLRLREDVQNQFLIEGLNGTTINGETVDDLTAISSVGVPVSVDLGNGHDSLEYACTNSVEAYNHFIDIDAGNGNDTVIIMAAGAMGPTRIETGTGNDSIWIHVAAGTLWEPFLDITTGSGHDAVVVDFDTASLLGYGWIDTAGGNDAVLFAGSFSSPRIWSVVMGYGNDVLVGDPNIDAQAVMLIHGSGGPGSDAILHSSYFQWHDGFETIIE